jgi:hypothetical protein
VPQNPAGTGEDQSARALFQHGWSALWVALRLKQLHLYQEYSLLIFWEVFSTSSAKHLLGLELLQ